MEIETDEEWSFGRCRMKEIRFEIEPLKETAHNLPLRYDLNQERSVEGMVNRIKRLRKVSIDGHFLETPRQSFKL